MASRTFPQHIGSRPCLPTPAARAAESFWPAELKQIRPASRLGRKAALQLQQILRIIFHRRKHYRLWSPESSKYPSHLNIEFISFREQIDTGGPLGRAIIIIVGAVAELERNLIVERVRAGMRRARLEGRHIGRNPLDLDRTGILRDRCQGQSLRQIAKSHRISTATVQRVLRKHATASQENVA